MSSIPAFGGYAVKLRRRLYVVDDRVDEMNLVPVLGKPASMSTRAAANVEHTRRGRRQKSPHQLLGSEKFETSMCRSGQARALGAGGVVSTQIVLAHRPTLTGPIAHSKWFVLEPLGRRRYVVARCSALSTQSRRYATVRQLGG